MAQPSLLSVADVEVARDRRHGQQRSQHLTTTNRLVGGSDCNGRGRALSGHARRRESHPRQWLCPRHLRRESLGHAQAPAKTERYKSMPRNVAVTNSNRHVNSGQRGVTHSPLNPLVCVWRGCAEVGESSHPFFDPHPTVPPDAQPGSRTLPP